MLANVVNCFPAMSSTSNRPRSISRRSPLTVIPPAGNPNRTPSVSRSGVSGVMLSGRRSIQGLSDTVSDREDSTVPSENLAPVDDIGRPTARAMASNDTNSASPTRGS